MQRKLWTSLVLLLTFVATACSSDVKDEGGEFVSEDGGFSIAFPGDPEESVQKIETEVGDVDTYLFMYEEGEDVVYLASYADYPDKFITEDNADDMLTGAVKGQLSTLGTDPVVDEEKPITVDGYSGFYVRAYGDGVYSVSKIVLADKRLYQILLMGNDAYVSQEKEDAFLGSLKINN